MSSKKLCNGLSMFTLFSVEWGIAQVLQVN